MKHMATLALSCFFTCFLYGQNLTFGELLHLTATSSERFRKYMSKHGFLLQEQQKEFVRFSYAGSEADNARPGRVLTKFADRHKSTLVVEKLSATEYAALKEKITKEGYREGLVKGKKVYTEIFQKEGTTIIAHAEIDLDAEQRLYNVLIESRPLPKAKELVYAEDLLQLNAHEHLVAVFGERNVEQDQFISADGRRINCSVLYPHTSKEAIFVWQDEQNFRNLLQLRIGGLAQTVKSQKFHRPVLQNQWVSKQGVFPNMTLEQLQQRNGQPVRFYGWSWNEGGQLTAGNTGNLDFEKIDIIFSCLNCSESGYKRNNVVSSATALQDHKRIHISTLILYPEKVSDGMLAQLGY